LDLWSIACRQSMIAAELGVKGLVPGKLQIGARSQATRDEVGTGDWGTGLRSDMHKEIGPRRLHQAATDQRGPAAMAAGGGK
jgi:hypothetical protein